MIAAFLDSPTLPKARTLEGVLRPRKVSYHGLRYIPKLRPAGSSGSRASPVLCKVPRPERIETKGSHSVELPRASNRP